MQVANHQATRQNEVKEMKNQMPWPPQPSDLDPKKFHMPKDLGKFLAILITSQEIAK